MKLLAEEIEKYFEENSNLVVSKENVRIEKRGIFYMIYYVVEERKEGSYKKYELHEQVMGPESLLEAYTIRSIEDLRLLSGVTLWERYCTGGPELLFTCDGATINFRALNGKTKIFSYELNYQGEVDKVFDKIEDFKNWVDENWEMIEEGVRRRALKRQAKME